VAFDARLRAPSGDRHVYPDFLPKIAGLPYKRDLSMIEVTASCCRLATAAFRESTTPSITATSVLSALEGCGFTPGRYLAANAIIRRRGSWDRLDKKAVIRLGISGG
jgi:hypothetical protein